MSAAASTEQFPVQILQSWGVASARHTSGCVVPPNTSGGGLPPHSLHVDNTEFLFDVPIGPNIMRWDIARQHRVAGQQFQAHSDLVTCMRRSPSGHYVATSCYSGGVKLWRGTEWTCVDEAEAPMASQHHVCLQRMCLYMGVPVLSLLFRVAFKRVDWSRTSPCKYCCCCELYVVHVQWYTGLLPLKLSTCTCMYTFFNVVRKA